jgi:hypothetical protein
MNEGRMRRLEAAMAKRQAPGESTVEVMLTVEETVQAMRAIIAAGTDGDDPFRELEGETYIEAVRRQLEGCRGEW